MRTGTSPAGPTERTFFFYIGRQLCDWSCLQIFEHFASGAVGKLVKRLSALGGERIDEGLCMRFQDGRFRLRNGDLPFCALSVNW
jgi:hypothetical protein